MAERGHPNLTDQSWDDLLLGQAAGVDPSVPEALRHIHTLYAAPMPGSARERARQRVFDQSVSSQENTMSATTVPIPFPGPDVRRPGTPSSWRPNIGIHSRRQRWGLISLAAALLILLAGIGAYLTIVPEGDRIFGGRDNENVVIPAAQPPFDPTGVSTIWETGGTDANPLDWPVAVAIAPDGNIYVANASTSTIEVFSPDGNHLESWGEEGDGPGQFAFSSGPFTLADLEFDNDGNLFVFDSLNSRVQKFAPDHTFLLEWGFKGTANPGEFDLTMGGVDGDLGLVYVSDRTGRIQVFDLDGNYQYQWGSTGTGPGEFTYPWDVDVVDGRVFIVDEGSIGEFPQGDPRVQEFDSSGTLIEGSGAMGSFFSDFSSVVHYIAFDPGGRLFVADYEVASIRIASPDGRLIDSLTNVPGGLSMSGPSGMAFDDEGNLYFVDDILNRLYKVAIPPGA